MIENNDFFQVRNFLVQLCADNEISQNDFLLYCFYQSLAGRMKIQVGYREISKNTGLSTATISRSNKTLEKKGLLTFIHTSKKTPPVIVLTPSWKLPKRKLYKNS